MLRPTDPSNAMPQPDDERPIGDIVHDLVEHGKAYARAEVGLVKAMAASKASAARVPALLFALALLLVISAFAALAVGGVLALTPLVGPLAAGLIVFLVLGAIAGACAWAGAKKLREDM